MSSRSGDLSLRVNGRTKATKFPRTNIRAIGNHLPHQILQVVRTPSHNHRRAQRVGVSEETDAIDSSRAALV